MKIIIVPGPGTKAFSRERPCPTIYKNPNCVELFSCPTISKISETCPLPDKTNPHMYLTWSPLVPGSDHLHLTPDQPSTKGILSQFKSLPPTSTPTTLKGTTPPRRQVPKNTHVHMHLSWNPRVLDSNHWHYTQACPSQGWPSNHWHYTQGWPSHHPKGDHSSQETGTRQDTCPHVPKLIPSSSSLKSLASYSRLALCQRNPLPIQIPPTYIHSRHPKGDHSSQETGTRQDPCSRAPELIPSSSRLRSLTSYPRLALCQRNPLQIRIPPTYSHSSHPTGDHSSQETGTRQEPSSHVPKLIPLSCELR